MLPVHVQERINTGTTWSNNKFFDENGYLVIRDLWNPEELYHPLPEERGMIRYWGKKLDQYTYEPVEQQVEGSLARYWYPQYREIHCKIRSKLEEILGRKLYNTYYYDRYYFPGQELSRHVDRDACEISVTVHISSNLPEPECNWPIHIKSPDVYVDERKRQILTMGKNHSVILNPGDGMIYKGCERPHWRDPMPGCRNSFYYHQIFFHYVLQDGQRAHCAWDRA